MDNPLATGSAPAKIILFGEHAVVYGRPAIAAPLPQLQAHATIYADSTCLIDAVDIGRTINVAQAQDDNPFAFTVRLLCAELQQPIPNWRIAIHSDIPIASGLGSGAAIAAAVMRAMLAGFDRTLEQERLSELVFEVERLHHGTPSGIDNTVVVYGRPIWFERGQPPKPFTTGAVLHLLVGDTAISSPTRVTVGEVRSAWQQRPEHYEKLFDAISDLVQQARRAIETADIKRVGDLMNENQAILQTLGVSSTELDDLCITALSGGAMGAKLSGGGRGGNMIALVDESTRSQVEMALAAAGARHILPATIT